MHAGRAMTCVAVWRMQCPQVRSSPALRFHRLEFQAARPPRARRLRRHGRGHVGAGREDGRRIIWLAHESAPKNFTAVDVTNPREPKIVVQTDLPESFMRSNSLEITGDVMAVAYQCQKVGQKPAGFELFDISVPEKPKSIAFVDRSGPHSRGVHQFWFCDGNYVHMASGARRLPSDASARRPVLPDFRRAQSVEAGGGRALVDAGHARGRQRAAAGAPSEAAL